MLKKCAHGFSVRLTGHHRRIKCNGRIYPSFPKHDHVEVGHVRKLIRNLNIDKDCALEYVGEAAVDRR